MGFPKLKVLPQPWHHICLILGGTGFIPTWLGLALQEAVASFSASPSLSHPLSAAVSDSFLGVATLERGQGLTVF